MNHHQIDFCRSLSSNDCVSFNFISMEDVPYDKKLFGYNVYSDQFIVKAYESAETLNNAINLVRQADVLILGSDDDVFLKHINERQIVFKVSEHFQKYTYFNAMLWLAKNIKYTKKYSRIAKLNRAYLLSSSYYSSYDYRRIGFFEGKCLRWGYFPSTVDDLNAKQREYDFVWCGRFIKWKHPNYCIFAAEFLKKNNIPSKIILIGDGPLLPKIKNRIKRKKLESYFEILGSVNSSKVSSIMANCKYLLFTSDKQEGWGAVLNEAMGSGCVPIASEKAGSTKYLVSTDNGFVFNGKKEFIKMIKRAIELSNDKYKVLSENCFKAIKEQWNGENASRQLLNQINNILNTDQPSKQIKDGPASLIQEEKHL